MTVSQDFIPEILVDIEVHAQQEVGEMVRLMGGHKLGFLSREHNKEVMVFWGDNFSNQVSLIHWEWLDVEGGSQSRIISDSSELSCALRWASWHVAEGKDLVALVHWFSKRRGPNQADWGWFLPLEKDSVHFFQEG